MKASLKIALAVLFLTASVFYWTKPLEYVIEQVDPQLVPRPFVSGQLAYAHYMQENYAVRSVYCRINFPDGAIFEYIPSAGRCSKDLKPGDTHGRDPSLPILWTPDHVTMRYE